LEPLAARRSDGTLAVEPVELVPERCVDPDACSPAVELGGKTAPLCYGECFRLRISQSNVYLGHGGDGGCLRWEHLSARDVLCHHGLRFAAHGSELGAPLLLGRPLSLRRVTSLPASDSEPESDISGSDTSESDSERLLRGAGLKRVPNSIKAQKSRRAQSSSSQSAATQTSREVGALLMSVVGASGVFDATFLPSEDDHGDSAQGFPSSDEEEIANMDTILVELQRQLQEARETAQEQHAVLERSNQHMAELESRILQGEKLRQATKEARGKKMSSGAKAR